MDDEREKHVDEIRATAARAETSDDPLVKYLAGWLVFFIDEYRATRGAWQRSIEAMRS